jgi:phosphatidylglycerophosphatase A
LLVVKGLLVFWVLMFFLGIAVCRSAEKILGQSDHSSIVIDEFVAYGLLLVFIPNNLYLHTVAFVLFRIFDIFKPLGIRYIDQSVKGGLGVMLDDLFAAGYALCVLMILLTFVNFPL